MLLEIRDRQCFQNWLHCAAGGWFEYNDFRFSHHNNAHNPILSAVDKWEILALDHHHMQNNTFRSSADSRRKHPAQSQHMFLTRVGPEQNENPVFLRKM